MPSLGRGLGRGPLGGMPLGGGLTDLNSLVLFPINDVFRRAFIKRRLSSDGKFESDFTEITEFVKSWGSLSWDLDSVRINRFRHSGISLKCLNDTGRFNPEDNINSFWFGFLTRYRTLLKIEAGYKGCAPNEELPTDTTQGIFILDDEIPISGKTNDVVLKGKSLQSLFDEVDAKDVTGIFATQSASDIVTLIRDHTDGSGNFIFREFITSTSWTIQTTTTDVKLNSNTVEDLS